MGGVPFETAMKLVDGVWQQDVRKFGDIRNHKGYGPLDSEMDGIRSKTGYISLRSRVSAGIFEYVSGF